LTGSYSVDIRSTKRRIRILAACIISIFLLSVLIIYFGISIFPNATYFNSLSGKYSTYGLSFSYPSAMTVSTSALLGQNPDMNSGMIVGKINRSGVAETLFATWVVPPCHCPLQPSTALQASYQEFLPYLPNSIMNYNVSNPAWHSVQGFPAYYENFTFAYNSAIYNGVVQTWYDPTSQRIYSFGFLSDTTDWTTVYNGIMASFRGH
jgi:hypothetical protein